MIQGSTQKQARLAIVALTAVLFSNFIASPAMAQSYQYSPRTSSARRLPDPTRLPVPRAKQRLSFQPDTLLIMPAPNANKDEIAALLRDLNVTATETFGTGKMQVIKLKVETKRFVEIERKLAYDPHFRHIQRNYCSTFSGQ